MALLRLVFIFLITSTFCHANTVSEVIKYFSKVFSRELSKEGGETLVKFRLQKLQNKYGSSILPLLKKLGPESASLARKFGDDGLRIITKFEQEGMRMLAKYNSKIINLARRYGDDVVVVFSKHSGLGPTIVKELGADGIIIAKKLTTTEMIKLLRITPALKKAKLLAKATNLLKQSGSKALQIVLKYPMSTVGVVGGTYFIAKNSDSLSKPGEKIGKEIGSAVRETVKYAVGGVLENNSDRRFLIIIIALIICFVLFLRHRRLSVK